MNKKLFRIIGIQIILLGLVLSVFEFLIDRLKHYYFFTKKEIMINIIPVPITSSLLSIKNSKTDSTKPSSII